MDAPLLDESTLSVGHKIIHQWCEASGKHLGDDFSNGMNQANRPIVIYLFGPIFLWQEHNVGRVDPLEMSYMEVIELMNGTHNILFNDGPTFFEECTGETIGPGRFIGGHLVNGKKNFLLREGLTDSI
jgi:hypothetical protein